MDEGGGCLLTGGSTLSMPVGLGCVLFEDHPYCGPMPVTRTGLGRTLSASHRFWNAATEWYASGKRIDADGRCILGPHARPPTGRGTP